MEGGIPTEKSSQVSDNCCHLTGTLSAAIKTKINKQLDGKTTKRRIHTLRSQSAAEITSTQPQKYASLYDAVSVCAILHIRIVLRGNTKILIYCKSKKQFLS